MSGIERGPGGRFAGGRSANPGGRPAGLHSLTELARQRTAQAVALLAEIMADAEASAAARVSAACAILDRGWGRPTQPIADAREDVSAMSDDELASEINRLEQLQIAAQGSDPTNDGAPVT